MIVVQNLASEYDVIFTTETTKLDDSTASHVAYYTQVNKVRKHNIDNADGSVKEEAQASSKDSCATKDTDGNKTLRYACIRHPSNAEVTGHLYCFRPLLAERFLSFLFTFTYSSNIKIFCLKTILCMAKEFE